jgi:hypothetical protein
MAKSYKAELEAREAREKVLRDALWEIVRLEGKGASSIAREAIVRTAPKEGVKKGSQK